MAVKKVVKKRKEFKNVDKGQVHIKSSFNNTIITITDANGNTITQCSSGALGYRGSRKSTPFAAQQASETAAKVAMEHGLRSVEVFVKGPGQGRDGHIFSNDSGGSMSAVSGSESIIAENIAVGSQLFGKDLLFFFEFSLAGLEIGIGFALFLLAFGLFFFVVTGILKHDDIAGFHSGNSSIGSSAVIHKNNALAEKFFKISSHGFQSGIGGDAFFIGTAEVAHQNQAAALFQNVFDGGKSALHTGIIFDDAFFDGHVEVNAHDNFLTLEINVTESQFIHFITFSFSVNLRSNKKRRNISARLFFEG